VRRARLSDCVLFAGVSAASLLLASCGGGDNESSGGPGGQQTAAGSSFASTWPLTGLPVKEGADSAQEHPVVVAKVDNSGSEPQAGLSQADLVVEELVEGGITRLAAFFYSELPDSAGPIRSMRFSDIGIIGPADAVIATSGAAPITIKQIKEAGLRFVTEGADGFSRDSGRTPPYNLMADLTKVAKAARQDAARPDDYLPWGPAGASLGGRPARQFEAVFSGAHTSRWKYAGGGYQLLDANAPAGDSFKPGTVLVLMVKTTVAGYKDPAGNPVPETRLTGKGPAMVFHGGKLVRGTWNKDGFDGALTLSAKGSAIKVPAGHVWIELVPRDGGKVTVG
jgi:hypothetical protein